MNTLTTAISSFVHVHFVLSPTFSFFVVCPPSFAYHVCRLRHQRLRRCWLFRLHVCRLRYPRLPR